MRRIVGIGGGETSGVVRFVPVPASINEATFADTFRKAHPASSPASGSARACPACRHFFRIAASRRQLRSLEQHVGEGLLADVDVDLPLVAPADRVLAGQQEVQRRAEGPDVRLGAEGLVALPLLGRHVLRRADDALRVERCAVLVLERLGDAEVGEFHFAAPRDQDVVGLDVAVDDGLLIAVGLGQAARGAEDDRRGLEFVQATLAHDALARRLAVDEFHHQVMESVRSAIVVDAHEVFVGQAGRQLGLAPEARDELLVLGRQRRLEALHRHVDVEIEVPAAVDRAHAALADLGVEHDRRENFPALDQRDRFQQRIMVKSNRRRDHRLNPARIADPVAEHASSGSDRELQARAQRHVVRRREAGIAAPPLGVDHGPGHEQPGQRAASEQAVRERIEVDREDAAAVVARRRARGVGSRCALDRRGETQQAAGERRLARGRSHAVEQETGLVVAHVRAVIVNPPGPSHSGRLRRTIREVQPSELTFAVQYAIDSHSSGMPVALVSSELPCGICPSDRTRRCDCSRSSPREPRRRSHRRHQPVPMSKPAVQCPWPSSSGCSSGSAGVSVGITDNINPRRGHQRRRKGSPVAVRVSRHRGSSGMDRDRAQDPNLRAEVGKRNWQESL